MKPPRLLPFLLLFCLWICLCGSVLGKRVETKVVWESGDEYIRLFREVDSGTRYDQPVHFHEQDMLLILQSIYYSRYEFFHWSNATRVFDEDQAQQLAPHFQRAFLDAGSEEVVEFYLPRQAKKWLGLSGQTFLTRGRAFVKGNRLHVHFFNVQHKIRSFSTHAEDQKALNPAGWKLVPQKGQAYEGEEAGSAPSDDSEDLHRLVIDLSRDSVPSGPPRVFSTPPSSPQAGGTSPVGKEPVRNEAGPAGTPPPPPAAAGSDARDKLRELRKMQQEGLISEQDYNRKKQEILDGF